MAVTRRGLGQLAVAGAVALGASTLLSRQPLAEATDHTAVAEAVKTLRQAILDRDVDKLRDDLLVDELSYGVWPRGGIQNKYEFIARIARQDPIFSSITYSGPSITIAGNNAIVRHREAVEADTNARHYSSEFDVLQVWQKQDGQWRLLARQAWKPEIS